MLQRCRALLSVNVPQALEMCAETRAEAERQGRRDRLALAMVIETRGVVKRDGADAAMMLLDRARAVLPADASPEARCHFTVVEVGLHYILNRPGVAAERLRSAFELATKSGSKPLQADCLIELHDLFRVTRTGHEPSDALDRAESILQELGDGRGLVRVRLRRTDQWIRQGREDDAVTEIERLLRLAHETGDLFVRDGALGARYGIQMSTRAFDAAIETALSKLEGARQLEDRELLAVSLDCVAWAHLMAGRPEEAAPFLDEAIEAGMPLGIRELSRILLESARDLALNRRDSDALMRHSLAHRELLSDELVGRAAEDRAIAERILREIRGERRANDAAAQSREAELRRAQQDSERRTIVYRWLLVAFVLALASTLAVVFFAGKRRAERTHAELAAHTERARELEEGRRRLEQHVNQLERLDSLGLLAAGIAHDFNNILCGIMGHAQSLDVDDKAMRQSSADSIVHAATRASALCNRMVDYAKPAPANAVATDLRDVVEGCRLLLNVAGSGAMRMTIELGDEPVHAVVDRTGIEQVLVNLVTNALDEGVAAQRVVVRLFRGVPDLGRTDGVWFGRLTAGRDYAALEVEDDGGGMSADQVRRVVDPFYTTKFEGRGLGLSAAYGIVAGHGGALFVQSEHGRGSTFTVFLPTSSTPDDLEPAASESVDPCKHGPIRVLVVDDEPMILSFAQRALEAGGHSVVTAATVEEALLELDRDAHRIDAVLLDLTMPGASGSELLEHVRRRGWKLRIVVMSGHGDEFVRDQIGGYEVDGLLKKPFRLQDLEQVLSSALERASA